MTGEQMEFPETFEGFAKEFGFKDEKEVYSNGIDLIPIFRVKQWLEQDNKLRAIEMDTAYECGKHSNRWIPVSERIAKFPCLACDIFEQIFIPTNIVMINNRCYDGKDFAFDVEKFLKGKEVILCDGEKAYELPREIIAWMPLPEPYKEESEEEE